MLAHEITGRGPRLVLVHGFTQTRAHWGAVAGDLATDHQVLAVDAPGHGGSPPPTGGPWEAARLLGATAGQGTYVGYSMGGRLSLHVALARPDLVTGLVLVGVTAGMEDAAERARRVSSDEALATRLEAEGVDAFLAWWLAQPLFAGLDHQAAGVPARRESTAAGLAASLRHLGTGAQEPLWDRLGELAMPVLAVAGAEDHRFAARARRLADAVGADAQVALVPGAGHSVHLEAPSAFLAVLRRWLAAHHV